MAAPAGAAQLGKALNLAELRAFGEAASPGRPGSLTNARRAATPPRPCPYVHSEACRESTHRAPEARGRPARRAYRTAAFRLLGPRVAEQVSLLAPSSSSAWLGLCHRRGCPVTGAPLAQPPTADLPGRRRSASTVTIIVFVFSLLVHDGSRSPARRRGPPGSRD